MKYRDIIKNCETVYKVECSFFSEPIYFYMWEGVIAFMKKTIGFDYKITKVNRSKIPGQAPVYVARDLDEETFNIDEYSDSSYQILHYSELIGKL